MAGLLLTSCVRDNIEPNAYTNFFFSDVHFGGDSKLYFDYQGLWWDDGDLVYINGKEHTLFNEGGGSWRTVGERVEKLNGKFYVGIPWAEFDPSLCRYGEYDFTDGVTIPLAIAGTSNRMTLWPCCAVIRSTRFDQMTIEAIWNGEIARTGYIYPGETLDACRIEATDWIVDGDEITKIDGPDAYYYVLPLVSSEVEIVIVFSEDWEEVHTTAESVKIKKGYFYDLG